ncbi:hypothetical protein ACTVZO_05290 [Streptomyces sp. IBSNAI002]|uniref:hypothetical protein n=1 Tax=Streptomyces sp. IBSNAI002 TaxID=3457500 RepID=UPI003FD29A21
MYPSLFTTPGLARFAEELDAERGRQLAKFGDQRHPDGTGGPVMQARAQEARNQCQFLAKHGGPDWRAILLEEVYEALAESDPPALRAELVQVAAVCAAWLSDLDRRPPAGRCDVMFVGGGRCAKSAGHRPPGSQDPHTP